MARYKPVDTRQMLMLEVSLEKQLAPGTLEFAIHQVIEEHVELSGLEKRYRNDETGCPAYHPKVLLKVVLLGYARGMLSSRQIERACRENMTFLALTGGRKPDHSTIAEFVSKLGGEIEKIFQHVLLVCEAEGLLGGTHFSLDGVKLPSNASKECSGTHEDLEHKQEKIEAKVREVMKEHRERDKDESDEDERDRHRERMERLKRESKRIGSFLKTHAPRLGSGGTEIQSNVTDPESAKMKTSHGMVQGYNANVMVDGTCQVIVHGEAFGNGQDNGNAGPMLEGAQRNLETVGKTVSGAVVTADSNYHSEKNLKACEEAGVDAYIPDTQFRQRDARFATRERHKPEKVKGEQFDREDFGYNAAADCFVCPRGEKLKRARSPHRVGEFVFRQYRTRSTACRGCPDRMRCFGEPVKAECKTIEVFESRKSETLCQRMRRKIDTVLGRKRYQRRLATVEPVFANLRHMKGMDRFTLRGKRKVNIQWTLYCIVHNVEKILHYAPRFA